MVYHSHSLIAVPKRRLVTRVFAFLAILCHDIRSGIDATVNTAIKSTNDDNNNDNHNHNHGANNASPTNDNGNYIHVINDHEYRPIMELNDTSVRISFSLHDPMSRPFENVFAPRSSKTCSMGNQTNLRGNPVRDGRLPPSLTLGGFNWNSRRRSSSSSNVGMQRDGGRVLDFTTSISTNLKILHIGDSITIQIAQAMDEMMMVKNDTTSSSSSSTASRRQQLWESWSGADGGTLLSPTRGGGINGAWRITGLLSKKNQGKLSMYNARDTHAAALGGAGGGWNYDKVYPFLRHSYSYRGREDIKVERVDVVVFRVMHGWMDIEDITRERVIEAAELAHSILGAETIVFMTVPFTNNVNTAEIMEGVRKVNDMIRDIANNWHLLNQDGTQVLVLDYAMYVNHVIWTNARHIGYTNVSNPLDIDIGASAGKNSKSIFDKQGPNFLQERIKFKFWPPSIPMVCSKKPTAESEGWYCDRNFLFSDGIHFCSETLSARIGAGIACLLGCVYNRKEGGADDGGGDQYLQKEESSSSLSKMRACERQCNEQFMSVMPVKEAWVDHSETDHPTTLASFSDV